MIKITLDEQEKYMTLAIKLAKRALGHVSPNPPVGAVIVKNGKIIGKGYHKKAGEPHAEVNAINSVEDKKQLKNSSLFVTLEPCNHYGKTPPCTEAIIKAGIKEVFIGTIDPSDKVCGKGVQRLRDAGIKVVTGILEDKCRYLIAPFAKASVKKMPWVMLKIACSLDGKISSNLGQSKWITNKYARAYGHFLRGISDAIIVGKNTIVYDDPKLTCRIKSPATKNPTRIVLDTKLSLKPTYNVFLFGNANTIIVCDEKVDPNKEKKFEEIGVDVLKVPTHNNKIDLNYLFNTLCSRGYYRILVEGGSTLHGNIIDKRLFDEIFIFYAPIIIGGHKSQQSVSGKGADFLRDAPKLTIKKTKFIKDNLLVHCLYTDINAFWQK